MRNFYQVNFNDMFDEPKDIFAEAEKPQLAQGGNPPIAQAQRSPNFPITPPPTQLPPSYAAMNQPAAIHPPEHRGSTMKIVVVIVIILIILGISGVFAYQIMTQPAASDSVVNAVPSTGVTDTTTPTPEAPAPVTPSAPVAPVEPPAPVTQTQNPASLLDSDGDGLSNARELELGTSVTKADTDGDGLGDKEEVDVYGTNPRKVDSDGDGFLDGAEVANGYNPNGPGKLFTVPTTTATPAGS